MIYQKALAERIEFDNSDIITTSDAFNSGDCKNKGHMTGNNCNQGLSSNCDNQSWKD